MEEFHQLLIKIMHDISPAFRGKVLSIFAPGFSMQKWFNQLMIPYNVLDNNNKIIIMMPLFGTPFVIDDLLYEWVRTSNSVNIYRPHFVAYSEPQQISSVVLTYFELSFVIFLWLLIYKLILLFQMV